VTPEKSGIRKKKGNRCGGKRSIKESLLPYQTKDPREGFVEAEMYRPKTPYRLQEARKQKNASRAWKGGTK